MDHIYSEFVNGLIRNLYTSIKLIPESIDVRLLSEDRGIVIFKYSTDCILRESGEPFGMTGIETQVYSRIDGRWYLEHVHYSKED